MCESINAYKIEPKCNNYKHSWPSGLETSLSRRSTGFESPHMQTLKHGDPRGYSPI